MKVLLTTSLLATPQMGVSIGENAVAPRDYKFDEEGLRIRLKDIFNKRKNHGLYFAPCYPAPDSNNPADLPAWAQKEEFDYLSAPTNPVDALSRANAQCQFQWYLVNLHFNTQSGQPLADEECQPGVPEDEDEGDESYFECVIARYTRDAQEGLKNGLQDVAKIRVGAKLATRAKVLLDLWILLAQSTKAEAME